MSKNECKSDCPFGITCSKCGGQICKRVGERGCNFEEFYDNPQGVICIMCHDNAKNVAA